MSIQVETVIQIQIFNQLKYSFYFSFFSIQIHPTTTSIVYIKHQSCFNFLAYRIIPSFGSTPIIIYISHFTLPTPPYNTLHDLLFFVVFENLSDDVGDVGAVHLTVVNEAVQIVVIVVVVFILVA